MISKKIITLAIVAIALSAINVAVSVFDSSSENVLVGETQVKASNNEGDILGYALDSTKHHCFVCMEGGSRCNIHDQTCEDWDD